MNTRASAPTATGLNRDGYFTICIDMLAQCASRRYNDRIIYDMEALIMTSLNRSVPNRISNPVPASIGVLGAGTWGIALARMLTNLGHG